MVELALLSEQPCNPFDESTLTGFMCTDYSYWEP